LSQAAAVVVDLELARGSEDSAAWFFHDERSIYSFPKNLELLSHTNNEVLMVLDVHVPFFQLLKGQFAFHGLVVSQLLVHLVLLFG
jgi:hypothetical protein